MEMEVVTTGFSPVSEVESSAPKDQTEMEISPSISFENDIVIKSIPESKSPVLDLALLCLAEYVTLPCFCAVDIIPPLISQESIVTPNQSEQVLSLRGPG